MSQLSAFTAPTPSPWYTDLSDFDSTLTACVGGKQSKETEYVYIYIYILSIYIYTYIYICKYIYILCA